MGCKGPVANLSEQDLVFYHGGGRDQENQPPVRLSAGYLVFYHPSFCLSCRFFSELSFPLPPRLDVLLIVIVEVSGIVLFPLLLRFSPACRPAVWSLTDLLSLADPTVRCKIPAAVHASFRQGLPPLETKMRSPLYDEDGPEMWEVIERDVLVIIAAGGWFLVSPCLVPYAPRLVPSCRQFRAARYGSFFSAPTLDLGY